MFLGWFASRLGWELYLKQIKFKGPNKKAIKAELAGAPTADWGEIPGDLIGLRLTSTNSNANCCTILCSETTGCMRMEAVRT